MIITNKHNYPQALVNFAVAHTRKPSLERLSVTRLCDSPQIDTLIKNNWDEIVTDVSSRSWALISTALHEILGRHSGANTLTEEKLTLDMYGVTISGMPDLYEEPGILSDWKFVKVATLYYDSLDKFANQLNVYAFMLHHFGFPTVELYNTLIFRDWTKGKTVDPEYPQTDIVRYKQELWNSDKQLDYIESRIQAHKEWTPEVGCTFEERWGKKTVWAVTKKGNKRSLKNHDNEKDANWHCSEMNKLGKSVYFIEERKGDEWARCRDYCEVAGFCDQFKKFSETDKGE